MSLDGTYAATVDRVVEAQAVLLIEDDGETVAERHLPASELPEGAGEGAVLEVTLEGGEVVEVSHRPEETAERRERMRDKFDRLSRRLGETDDGGDADGGTPDGGEEDDPTDG